ncbi:hypothetical protein Tco_1080095 [Tanacetum coccineum]|uniref:Uncharacterized protein n=1 Tax=Tanacetum coccineum TaxID=301880 RepID=A0ABQ5HUA2_9ASTR
MLSPEARCIGGGVLRLLHYLMPSPLTVSLSSVVCLSSISRKSTVCLLRSLAVLFCLASILHQKGMRSIQWPILYNMFTSGLEVVGAISWMAPTEVHPMSAASCGRSLPAYSTTAKLLLDLRNGVGALGVGWTPSRRRDKQGLDRWSVLIRQAVCRVIRDKCSCLSSAIIIIIASSDASSSSPVGLFVRQGIVVRVDPPQDPPHHPPLIAPQDLNRNVTCSKQMVTLRIGEDGALHWLPQGMARILENGGILKNRVLQLMVILWS